MSLNNINNIGFHVFDPVLNFTVSSYIQESKLLDLLNYALYLSKLIKKRKYKQPIKYLDIGYSHTTLPKETTEELQKENKELLDLVNQLYTHEINLYNLYNGIIKFVENNKLDLFTKNKDDIIDYLLNPNSSTDDDLEFNIKFKLNGFEKLKFEEYKILNIEELSEEVLQNNTIDLSDEIEKLNKNIIHLVQTSENFFKKSENGDPETVQPKSLQPKSLQSEIPLETLSIAPIKPRKSKKQIPQLEIVSTQQPQEGGGQINDIFILLNKLKNNLDGVSSLTLEKEIPSGINLQLDDIKKILSDFKLTLELQAKPANDTNDTKYKKNWEYNLFEEIPEYKRIKYDTKKGFITNPLEPSIPQETDKVLDSSLLIKIINDKEKYMLDKILDISGIIGDDKVT